MSPLSSAFTTCTLLTVSVGGIAATTGARGVSGEITYTYIGAIEAIADEKNILTDAFVPTDPFALLARFDPAAPDSNPDPIWGAFESTASPPRLTLALPGLSLSAPTASAAIADNLNSPPGASLDLFRLESTFDTMALGRHMAFFIQLLLLDETAAALTSTALPTTSPNPTRFTTAQLIITGTVLGEPGQFTILASVTAIPSPGAVALGALSLALWASRRRRALRP